MTPITKTDGRHEAIRELTSAEIAAVAGGDVAPSFGGIGQIICAIQQNISILLNFFCFGSKTMLG